MLGDSMTFGYGVNDDETYPTYLEQRLNRVLASSPTRVEIIHAGVIGMGTGEEALWYERWVRRFNPELVIVNAFHNDFDDDRSRKLFVRGTDGVVARTSGESTRGTAVRDIRNAIPGYAFLVQHSHLAALLRFFASGQAGATRSASAAGAAPGADAARRSLASEAVEIQTAEIRYLRDRVLASHARLVVVAVPPRGAIYPADADADRLGAETMEHGLNTVCRAEHIPFFSGTRRIRELSDQSREPLYFTRDGHMTRAGNEAMALAVSEFLKNTHLLDTAEQ